MKYPFEIADVAEIVKELRKKGNMLPVAHLEVGDAKEATKAIMRATGLKKKPKAPFAVNGFVGRFYGLDILQSPDVVSNEIRMVDAKGNIIQRWLI